jgi:SAM-dependent methyltransferase
MSDYGTELDRLGDLYEEHHDESRDRGEFVFVPERIPFLVAALGSPGKRILDLGCRTGAVTQHFVPGNDVVGMDVDREALAVAARRGIEVVRGNVEERLPFADASFDAVVVGELLEHVRWPRDVVGEARRVLRPGGMLAGSVPNAYRLQSRLLFLVGRPPEDDPTHLHMYSPRSLRELLAGFDDVKLEFAGGQFRWLHPRLLARDVVFAARIAP